MWAVFSPLERGLHCSCCPSSQFPLNLSLLIQMQTTRNAECKGNGWNPKNASFFVVAVVVAAASATGTKADFDASI